MLSGTAKYTSNPSNILIIPPVTTPEHYIHSRLKSKLSSGPREMASAYSGIVDGNNLRRMASLNAEARTKMFYDELSPRSNGHSLQHPDGKGSPIKTDCESLALSFKDNNSSPGPAGVNTQSCILSPCKEAPSSVRSPLKSQKFCIMKDSTVHVVDILKTRPSMISPPSLSRSAPQPERSLKRLRNKGNNTPQTSYMKRMAALNARACVNALMNAYLIQGKSQQIADSVLGKRTPEQSGNSNQNNGKKKKQTEDDVNITRESSLDNQSGANDHQSMNASLVSYTSYASELECTESIPSSDEDDYATSAAKLLLDEEMPYNRLGLLYNSDTVHVSSSILLTSDGKLPSKIIPIIVPKTQAAVTEARNNDASLGESVKNKARKGDNGWTTMGCAIKTIDIKIGGGTKDIVTRKYYIGIKRKNEVVYVRDSIVVRSGRKKTDVPYIAKIASIWQEADGIMLTVFWYYRPEDVDKSTALLFHDHEVMGSQHYDDIGVACIDDKCTVLGLTQFCRYIANEKRTEAGIAPRNIIPFTPGHNNVEETSYVYFCCRAYHHNARKIIRTLKY